MRDLERWKDKVELSLDGRQIFFLFFGSAVAACLIFVAGVLIGKRLEARALALTPPPVEDPLAALDQLGEADDADESLTYHKALTRTAKELKLTEAKLIDAKLMEPPLAPKELKQPESKPETKPAEAKIAEAKIVEAKIAEAKIAEAKIVEAKIAEAKIAEPKIVEAKIAEPKIVEAKNAEPTNVAGAAQAKNNAKADLPKLDKPQTDETLAELPRLPKAQKDAPLPPGKPQVVSAAAPAKKPEAQHFTLQLSAFPERSDAEEFMRKIQSAGYKPFLVVSEIPGKGVFYRIRVGDYASRDAAANAKGEFERKQRMIAYVAKL